MGLEVSSFLLFPCTPLCFSPPNSRFLLNYITHSPPEKQPTDDQLTRPPSSSCAWSTPLHADRLQAPAQRVRTMRLMDVVRLCRLLARIFKINYSTQAKQVQAPQMLILSCRTLTTSCSQASRSQMMMRSCIGLRYVPPPFPPMQPQSLTSPLDDRMEKHAARLAPSSPLYITSKTQSTITKMRGSSCFPI